MQGGVKGELNLGKLLAKRAGVIATALRARPADGPSGKSEIVAEVVRNVWPMIADGRVCPIIGAEFGIGQAAAAHELLNSGEVARQSTAASSRLGAHARSRTASQPSEASARISWSTSLVVV